MKYVVSSAIMLFIALFCSRDMYAQKQGQEKIDSLVKVLESTPSDTNSVKLYNTIAFIYHNLDPEQGIRYGNEGYKLAKKLDWKKGIALVYNSLGSNYRIKADYSQALEYFFEALAINEEIGNKLGIAHNVGNIGIVYKTQENYQEALRYYQKALDMYVQLGDKDGIGTNLGNIGITYEMLGDYKQSLEYQNKALKLYEEMGNEKSVAHNLGNIGLVYNDMGAYATALDYVFRAMAMNQEIGNKKAVANNYRSAGTIYLQVAEKHDRLMPVGKAVAEAVKNLEQGIVVAREIGDLKNIQEMHELLSKVNSLSGNYKEAFSNYKSAIFYRDSIFSARNAERIQSLITKRELDIRDKQIEIDRLAVEKKRNERVFYIAGIILLLLAIIFIVRNYRIKAKANILMQQKLVAENNLVQSELSKAEGQLKSFMDSIHEKNLLIDKFSADIETLRNKGNAAMADEHNAILLQLQETTILTDDEWKHFKTLFEKVHYGFLNRLKEKIPDLSPAEIRFMALSKLKLSNKEMAGLLGISTDAVRMNRHRLRKKLQLSDEVDIEQLADSV